MSEVTKIEGEKTLDVERETVTENKKTQYSVRSPPPLIYSESPHAPLVGRALFTSNSFLIKIVKRIKSEER